METKQTAIEWLLDILSKKLKRRLDNRDYILVEDLFEDFKQIEKEQIIEAYSSGWCNGSANMNPYGEFYYNETYGNNTQKDNTED